MQSESESRSESGSVVFTNDDSVSILLLDHPFSDVFKTRDNHEVLFRRINTFLMKHNVIKNNIIDLGAWMGDNSLPWAKNLKEKGKDNIVYAIDPSPNNCDYITKMCELNHITNVKTIKTAINDVNEVLTTNYNIDHCSFVYGGGEPETRVNAVSLDFLYEMKAIENVGYIHLDVEGMEYRVIQGSDALINACRPVITFEQHLEIDNYAILLAFLKNKNYSVYLIEEVLPGCRHDCRNSLAFPNEICSEALIQSIHDFIGKNVLIYMN